jgi:hypothetical protein
VLAPNKQITKGACQLTQVGVSRQSFETFMAQFNNCAQHNKWTQSEKLAQLKSSLVKDAGQVLWDSSPTSTGTFDQLVELLKTRYSGARQADKFRMELRARRRRSNESLSCLHQDIRRLIALAHPDLPAQTREVMATDYFVDSLDDPELILKIRERNPASLEEALRISLQLEAWAKDAAKQKFPQGEEGQRQRKSNGSATAEVYRTACLEAQVRKLQQELADLSARSSLQSQQAECMPTKTQFSSDQSKGTALRQSTRARYQPRTEVTMQQTWGCWHCGDPSHFRRSCPQLPQSQTSLSHGVGPPPAVTSSGPKSQPPAQTRVCRSKESQVYITLKLKGEYVSCLLDSGADLTMVPLSLIKRHRGVRYRCSFRKVYAANGTELHIAGEVVLPFQLGPKCILVHALISEDIEDIMLGIDFLTKQRCVWDFSKNSVIIQGVSCSLHAAPTTSVCRRIYAVQDTVLPPRQQCNMPVRATLDDLRNSGSAWLTEPRALQNGVYVGQTLLPEAHRGIMVRVMNTNQEPRLIRHDTLLGTAEPVDLQENSIETVSGETSTEPASRKVLAKLPEELTNDQVRQVSSLLTKYESAFSQHDFDIGHTHLVEHTIDTGSHRPIRQSLRRHPVAHISVIDNQVDEMLRHGVIEPAASPWASNVVLAKKKDGSMRLCVDYCRINDITYQDSYPLPHIDSCLSALIGASWYSTLDLSSGYHNVPIKECDKDKTAFITRRGCWRYNVMPFGLTCAPSVFQRRMDLVLSGLTYEMCMVYIDDIVVFSHDFDSHLQRLEQVLQRIQTAGLKLKASKCCMFQRKVEFLGHIVSAQGIEAQPSKITAVTEWPVPTNLTEVRSFLGLCSYYRRFIQGFAYIATPLHELMKKNVRFHWGSDQQKAFETLKVKLVSAPVLAMPSDQGNYYLDTDSSDFGLGAVLSQV